MLLHEIEQGIGRKISYKEWESLWRFRATNLKREILNFQFLETAYITFTPLNFYPVKFVDYFTGAEVTAEFTQLNLR